ncbi:PLP-dependent aminotransferase family protein [Marivita hallyeonensis]|uniref:DNA-binding transcriptional regulator, MocR family, contains an aminotransferase domain n=1 Tax=Marivita hallyeonensis TaxID=996342 RepID=A0A1M5NKS9_9RHOB|nr:PLP-dependent aminotransferase family protein [Marivita hallyeonensis]SHG89799.1 DNA-binding transcriptional regulator, MocR family, contains an aminotransferase domain [Marivita hallyeonensis]
MPDTISADQIVALPQAGPGPKYKRVADALRTAIASGALSPGDKLPPVRELAWSLGITPGTVARAYTLLVNAREAVAEVGRGTFVADPKRLRDPDPIEVDGVPHGSDGRISDINLISPALPNVGQARLIRQLMGEVAQNPPSGLMHYPNRRAFRPAREAVVRWLRGTPLGPLEENDIVLSHGGQNGIGLVLQTVLTGPSPVILVEELAYSGFRRAAELLRAKVVAVPMDAQGVRPDALEQLARTHAAQVFCTSPEVHNPTTGFTPLERRREIVDVARRCDLQVLEDDCYRMGTARAPTYRMLANERGWYVSSISKVLTPALRIGYAVAPHGQGAGLRRAAEHGFFGLATPLADLTTRLLTDPRADDLVDQVIAYMRPYIRAAVNALGQFDLGWREDVPFFWLKLPSGWRASAFCQAAESLNIKIRPAEDFVGREGRAPHAVRIAVNAQLPLAQFETAMHELRDLLQHPPEQISV